MNRKGFLLGAGTLFLTVIAAGLVVTAPDSAARAPAPALKLQADTFVPSETEISAQLNHSNALFVDSIAAGEKGTYIVQFNGPVQERWKERIAAAGGEILAYIPDFAFKVRMTPEQAAQVRRQPSVIWTGLFHPAFKIDPRLLETRETVSRELVKVRLEANSDAGQIAGTLAQMGVRVLQQDGTQFVVLAEGNQVAQMAQLSSTAWIEPFALHETQNQYAAGVILDANTANSNGYDGSTQIVAVADTGLGGGTASSAHADLPAQRISAIQNFSALDTADCFDVVADGAQDANSGHGTHTTLSASGDGGDGGIGKGTAPAANVVFQAVEEYVNFYGSCEGTYADRYYLIGLPLDLANLFQPAYDAGARVHSNSWGDSNGGAYSEDSAAADGFMWNNPEFLVTFSAGNDGVDANLDGVIDDDSMISPATAKNVLSVGASENDRPDSIFPCDSALTYTTGSTSCSSQAGINDLRTNGSVWGIKFGANPIKDDPTGGNAQQMAAFSSRGPTDDGRIKPDVVAPGTWVLSGYSPLYQQGYGSTTNPNTGQYQSDGYGFPVSSAYKYLGGTSMANPLAAGAAVLVRDFYQKTDAHNASAALVKATLINSAVDMLDENNDGAEDNDIPIPNVHEGWGLVNVARATDGSHDYIDELQGLHTGESAHYERYVAAGQPLKVTMVWTDYPSAETAAVNLVNDLNLTVSGPGGSPVFIGNVFSGGWSQSSGSADALNNVENVYVQAAAEGYWNIKVEGANVPQGAQPFALVIDFTAGTPPTPTASNTPTVTIESPATETPIATLEPTAAATATDTPTATPQGVPGTVVPGSKDGKIYLPFAMSAGSE